MPRIAFPLPYSRLFYKTAEQYRKCDIIIDTVCSVSGLTWLQLREHEHKSLRRNITIGIIAYLCWDYVGRGFEYKLATLLNRDRSNMINQAQRYRKYLSVTLNRGCSVGQEMTTDIYRESKKRLQQIFGK